MAVFFFEQKMSSCFTISWM